MGKYWLWETTKKSQEEALLDDTPIVEYFDDIIFGRKLKNFPGNMALHLHEIGKLTDDLLISGGNAFLFSDRLLHILLENEIDSFDYYPCSIKTSVNDEIFHLYYLIVIRDIIHCLDRDNSDLYFAHDDPGGELYKVISICINEAALDKDNDVFFRLGEDKKNVIVHDLIKNVIEKAGMTGMIFTPADGTYPAMDIDRQLENWLYEKEEYDYSQELEDADKELVNQNFPMAKYAFFRIEESEKK